MATRGRLQNKVAVTGASSGIGRAIALLFSAEGAHVVCADIADEEDYGNEVDEEDDVATHLYIQNSGGSSIFVRTDVGQSRDVENLIRSTVQRFGRLDIYVNNAGITRDTQPIWATPEATWDIVQQVNSKGVFLGCKYASGQMIRQQPHANGDRGWIVNVASVLGLVGLEKRVSYCAAKGAVVNMTRAVALDCAPHRIHVNAICPGFTTTRMTQGMLTESAERDHLLGSYPFRGLGIPDDVAQAALFLSSEDAGWVSGACFPVDGAFTAR